MSPIPSSYLDPHEKLSVLAYSQVVQSTAEEANYWAGPKAHFWTTQS